MQQKVMPLVALRTVVAASAFVGLVGCDVINQLEKQGQPVATPNVGFEPSAQDAFVQPNSPLGARSASPPNASSSANPNASSSANGQSPTFAGASAASGVMGSGGGRLYAVPFTDPATGQVTFRRQFFADGANLPAGATPISDANSAAIAPQPRQAGQVGQTGQVVQGGRSPQGQQGQQGLQGRQGQASAGFGTVVSRRVIGRSNQLLVPAQTSAPRAPEQVAAASNASLGSGTPTKFGITNLEYPPFLVPRATFTTGPAAIRDSGRVMCALTFDDGPHPELDPKVLDILEAKNVPATFFYLGRLINANPDIVRRANAAGHEIGQHSYDHQDMSNLGGEAVRSQIQRTTAALAKVGITAKVFRPPYGAYNTGILDEASSQGMTTVNWTNDSLDWRLKNPSSIINKVMENAAPGDVILLHSIQRATIAALPSLIDRLRAKGCEFATVSDWLAAVT